jgi:phosphatidate cytidylyltransferase
MLKTRVITAIVMALVVLLAIFGLPSSLFSPLVALIVLGIGGWEATRLSRFHSVWAIGGFPTLLLILALIYAYYLAPSASQLILICVSVTWIVPTLWLSQPSHKVLPALTSGLLGIILLGTWWALSVLQATDPWLIVWMVLIVASADVGAYFSGKALGGSKLAPQISPGKTWAGAFGGGIAAATMAPLGAIWLPIATPYSLATLALGGACLAFVSIVGDLFMSVLKRQAGLKDSSALLPGHGGLLDRLDSLSSTLPLFALVVATF